LHQSVFGGPAGDEDLRDVEQFCHDPAMHWAIGDRVIQGAAASASQMGRFEARPAERVVAFYNQRRTAEQWIKEGKGDQVDPAVMPHVRCERGPASAPYSRLQSRQLHANAGNA
jgi:hypothetical protein